MFTIAPADFVKGPGDYQEYRDQIKKLQDRANSRAAEIWKGYSFGGITPGPRQWGLAAFRPRDIHGGGTSTFVKRYGSPGSWMNVWSYTVPEDQIHAFAGIAISDPTLIFAQFRWEIEDKKFPIGDIEEAQSYRDGFRILLKQDDGKEFVVPEEQAVLLRDFQERATDGRNQRIVPLGFVLHKNKDNMIRETETDD